MTRKLTVTVASVPDREGLVAELWYGDAQWGEVSRDADGLRLEVYPQPMGRPWVMDVDEVLEAVRQARNALETG